MEGKLVEVYFYGHCDEEGCSMGNAEYKCPACLNTVDDYGDLWWSQDEEDSYVAEVQCEHCATKFKATKKEFNIYYFELAQ